MPLTFAFVAAYSGILCCIFAAHVFFVCRLILLVVSLFISSLGGSPRFPVKKNLGVLRSSRDFF